MFKRNNLILIVIIILVFGCLLLMPEGVSSRLKVIIGSVFLPIFGISSSVHKVTDSTINITTPRSELLSKIQKLEDENRKLKIDLMQMKSVWEENRLLRTNIGWAAQAPWRLKLARVIAREPSLWWKGFHIDLGSKDGIRPNLPVISPDGLVGRIGEVNFASSMVILLGDPKCRVSVVIPEANDFGIIAPSQAEFFSGRYLDLEYLTKRNELKPGQAVFTSGLGGLFPRGIPIGRIVDVRNADGLYLKARIEVSANLNALELVWVILQ
jgi:rod shape-determining protein MreC